jgi:rhodanese-related sulfurtransferase
MTDITVAELSALSAPVLIDVRELHEFEAGHAPGATHIPLGELADRLTEVPVAGPVYLICAVGGRSQRAVDFLSQHGVEAVNVTGGTNAWQQAGLPLAP